MNSTFNQFTNQYSVSKTLRFALKPIGDTEKYIQQNGLLKEDEKRAEDYKQVKKMIDTIHQSFLTIVLKKENIPNEIQSNFNNLLRDAYTTWGELLKENKGNNKTKKNIFLNLQKQLSKELLSLLDINMSIFFKSLENKFNLIQLDIKKLKEESLKLNKDKIKHLEALLSIRNKTKHTILFNKTEPIFYLLNIYFYGDDESLKKIKGFDKFHTYFSGFNKNRENIYNINGDGKNENWHFLSTSIANRLFEENLQRFFFNKLKWDTSKRSTSKYFNELKEKNWEFETKLKEIEKSLNFSAEDIFSPENFWQFFSQEGIDTYNKILGGLVAQENRKKQQGLNELINLTRQQINKKFNDFPKLDELYKQILSDRENNFVEVFTNTEEVLNEINTFMGNEKKLHNNTIKNNFFPILKEVSSSKKMIFLSKENLNKISHQLTGSWDTILYWYLSNLKDDKEAQRENKKKLYNIDELEQTFSKKIEKTGRTTSEEGDFFKWHVKDEYKKEVKQNNLLLSFFKLYLEYLLKEHSHRLELYENKFKNTNISQSKSFIENEVEVIKNYLDSSNNLFNLFKLFLIKEKDVNEDMELNWTSLIQDICNNYNISKLYNKVRNFVTKKPYSIEKFKLNFQNSSLLSGWTSKSGYDTKGSIILEKDNNFYLGIIDKQLSNEEVQLLKENASKNPINKVIYNFLPLDMKNPPRMFIRSKGDNFSPAVEKYQLPVKDILEIYDKRKFLIDYSKENPQAFRESLIKIIDYFKLGISKHDSFKKFSFKFKDSSKYKSIYEFYHDVANSCYSLGKEILNYDTLLNFVTQKKIYLFQIYNKDFSKYSKGKENLHTTYWKLLFDSENLKDVVLKLNGEAELFYRKASIPQKVTHPKGQSIDNKANKKKSIFQYNIIKDKRYTEDKFLFHCPITLNFKAPSTTYLNKPINQFLKEHSEKFNIIGIDRGEKHLLYYSVINQEGDILEQGSFNNISSNYKNSQGQDIRIETNYHTKLDVKEKDRNKSRKNWNEIENIKEIKAGYLSNIVHQLANLIIKYNAIVILEDLNFGFKRGRFKIEKQVYQKFEKTLIDKLNYLVFKDRKNKTEGGHYLNAYQLTNKFESFQRLGKQSGILFYVTASYTSKVDPVTGYLQNLYPKYQGIPQAQDFFKSFDEIKFNGEYFEFKYNLKNINNKGSYDMEDSKLPDNTERIVCSCVIRSKYSKNEKKHTLIDINEELILLFNEYKIEYQQKKCIKDTIIILNNKAFFHSLIYYFASILRMRVVDDSQDKGSNENDFIQSPVSPFYDSRKISEKQLTLPNNGDANGAYNIARKGIIILDRIKNEVDFSKKINLTISKKDWQDYVQKENIVKNQVEKYKKSIS